ncbi:hypothetical protein MBAV_000862 [Candidatus Magnetobacterium bavaricum]|uniref:FG-GAP repeat-containing protein n=1 Tax=Candidatus Magnetobacterium bavaricum TaxID=29290 RepID=A0A0F3GYJ2_9BACT|nr:hypothetical protein MBAV_000862 [Candidatus Magnetobacterium bavaricum]
MGNDGISLSDSNPPAIISTLDHSWEFKGYGSFYGNARKDCILWQNGNDGLLAIWRMDGTRISATASLPIVSADWQIIAVADFDGDSVDDILWQQVNTGQLAIWFMQDGEHIKSTSLVTYGGNEMIVDGSWQIRATYMFDSDAMADMLWQNTTTGQVVMWIMNGAAITTAAPVTHNGNPMHIDSSWLYRGLGYFNADNQADILWHNPDNGIVVIWNMDGASISSVAIPGVVGGEWLIQ